MKDLMDLKVALRVASDKQLIEDYLIETYYLDIDFRTDSTHRTGDYVKKILDLRDYIRTNYSDVHAIDYMPILNRLRLYGNFQRIK